MNTKKTVTYINIPEVNEKAIRRMARKMFGQPTNGQWDFDHIQLGHLKQYFDLKYKMADKMEQDFSTPAPAPSTQGGLTPHENAVMTFLTQYGWFEMDFSDLTVEDIATAMELPIASMKGYIGSLTKKEYVYVSEPDGEVPSLVYPYKHSIWNDELKKYQY